MRVSTGSLVRVAFGLVGLAFLVVAFLQTWDRSQPVVPAWPRLGASLLLVAVGLHCGFRGWAALLERPAARPLAAGFYISQLGKYVPGGVWQAAGQVGYARQADVSLGRAATAFAVFAITQSAAGAVVGATLALLAPGLPGVLRALALAPLLLTGLLDRRWMAAVVGWYQRRRSSEPAESVLPAQRSVLSAWAWGIVSLTAYGLAFATLLGEGGVGFSPAGVPAFALAWTVGFLALPFPAGLGVREVVLVAALGGVAPTAAVIATSVVLRLVVMVAEALMILEARWLPVRSPVQRRSGAGKDPPGRAPSGTS